MVFSTLCCSSFNMSRNPAQTVPSLIPLTHYIFVPTNIMLLWGGKPTVDKLVRKRFFRPKNAHQIRLSSEEISNNQNPVQMLSCLLGYNFLEGRHSSSEKSWTPRSPVLQVSQKGRGSPFQRSLSIDLDLAPCRTCSRIEDPPTMLFCVTLTQGTCGHAGGPRWMYL